MNRNKDPLQGLSRTKSLWTTRQASNTPRDMYWVYEFLRRLSTPFIQWPAFKAGIIDDKGNILVSVKDLTPKQQQNWNYIDALSVGIKNLIGRVPNTKQKLATITGTMMLMREHAQPSSLTPAELANQFDTIFNNLVEDGIAVNSVGAGNVQGIGIGPKGEPGGKKALLGKIMKRRIIKEFVKTPKDDDDKPERPRCWDCGSNIKGRHTALCDLAGKNDKRDLPSFEDTQWWTKAVTPLAATNYYTRKYNKK